MGACGCGDYQPMVRLPGPPGIRYTLALYCGCSSCGSDPGLIITRHGDEVAERWGDDRLPEPDWLPYTPTAPLDAEWFVHALDLDVLRTTLLAFIEARDRWEAEDDDPPSKLSRSVDADECMGMLRSARVWWPHDPEVEQAAPSLDRVLTEGSDG